MANEYGVMVALEDRTYVTTEGASLRVAEASAVSLTAKGASCWVVGREAVEPPPWRYVDRSTGSLTAETAI